jgi:PAS domain S-box-containing protein
MIPGVELHSQLRAGMKLQNHIQPILQLWNRLIEPVGSVQGIDQRRQARLLAGLLLMVALIVIAILPLRYLADAQSPYTAQRLFSAFLAFAAILFAYGLTRRGHYLIAGELVVGFGSVIIFLLAAVVGPTVGMGMLYYTMVVTLFATLFLPIVYTSVVAVLHLVAMLLLPSVALAYNLRAIIDGPASFSLLLTLIALVFAGYRAQLERHRQAQMSESENRYRMISEVISDYAFSYRVEPNGEIIHEWVTEAYKRVTGFDVNESPPIGRARFFHPDDEARVDADIQMTIRGKSTTGEYRIITKDGRLRWLMIYRTPVWNKLENRVVRYFGAAQDITARKQAEAEALKMALQQERLNVLGNFMEAVSHDFRTSLATIETSRYLLEQTLKPTPTEKTEKRLTSIQRAVFHLTEQLENLNTVSSLLAPDIGPCDLNALLQPLVQSLLPITKQRKIEMVFSPAADLPPVLFDNDQLQRAVKHLLVNAVTYTPEGGTVTVRTCRTDDMVQVEISDTGVGIDEHHLPHIFNYFYRADPARPTYLGGIGLGLSIVRMIVQAHNGTIAVKSTLGEGSTFTIALPVAEGEKI